MAGQRRREWSEAGLYIMSSELRLWSCGHRGLVFMHDFSYAHFFRHWFPNGESGEEYLLFGVNVNNKIMHVKGSAHCLNPIHVTYHE